MWWRQKRQQFWANVNYFLLVWSCLFWIGHCRTFLALTLLSPPGRTTRWCFSVWPPSRRSIASSVWALRDSETVCVTWNPHLKLRWGRHRALSEFEISKAANCNYYGALAIQWQTQKQTAAAKCTNDLLSWSSILESLLLLLKTVIVFVFSGVFPTLFYLLYQYSLARWAPVPFFNTTQMCSFELSYLTLFMSVWSSLHLHHWQKTFLTI